MKRLSLWILFVAAILTLPFITKAPWTLIDYTFAGVVLISAGVIYEFTTRKIKHNLYRYITGGIIAAVLLLIWAWAVA